ncbi:oxidoreductase, partial [Magnaporthiopsis poae ATCC 64411]
MAWSGLLSPESPQDLSPTEDLEAMAHSKAAKKRKQSAQVDQPRKAAKTAPAAATRTPPDSDDNGATALEPKSLHSVISDEELEIAVETLTTLAKHPSLIKSKQCKDLRAAVFDFRQNCTSGVNNASGTSLSLTARVTGALTDEKYDEARILLAEMKIRGQEPKLGALCRWVRDLDVISGLSTCPDGDNGATAATHERSERDKQRLLVLDAILRACGHSDSNPHALPLPLSAVPGIAVQEIWDLHPPSSSSLPSTLLQTYASVLDKTIFDSAPTSDLASSLRVIERTPGPQRKPPNHHDALLYTTMPGTSP